MHQTLYSISLYLALTSLLMWTGRRQKRLARQVAAEAN